MSSPFAVFLDDVAVCFSGQAVDPYAATTYPSEPTHPFRFTQASLDTFRGSVFSWIQAEQTAP